MTDAFWVRGDASGLQIPAHPPALREGGARFLTQAFHASGALLADNRVVGITRCEECPGGSTGRKLLLAVEYERPQPSLHRELFVKFSRDFDDAIRDRGRTQMEGEVRFAALSRMPGFPIAVPVCYFADYEQASGTGLLVSQRIAFGRDGIERHYEKCLDDEMPEPLAHYRALLTAVARLAGTHKAGGLPAGIAEQFAFDAGQLSVGRKQPYTAQQLQNRVARYADFVSRYPQLLPAAIRSPDFISRLHAQVARFPQHEAAIWHELGSRPDHVALCHWNANVDNAWFWRDAESRLECGLMDWGCVSQMNVAMAIWGALSAASTPMLIGHFDELLALFADEFHACGGPALDTAVLRRQLLLYVAVMGLAWLLDAPPYIRAQVPDLDAVPSRSDARIRDNETARSQLQIMSNFLSLWEAQDCGGALDECLGG